jgi:molybdenum cofactor cytidylyltransferase
LVGGGGKTSAMFRLAASLAHGPDRWRVLTTTTTRIFAAQLKLAPAHLCFDPTRHSLATILPALEAAVDRHGQVLLVGKAEPGTGKAFGLAPEMLDALAATHLFDVIINEADGSRMRPFKAPAAHEPVIPASTSLVVPVAGVDVLGRPLTDATVHRPQLVSRLSGSPLGQPVTTDTVAAVLGHPEGGLKHVPPAARVVPLLNKAATPASQAAAASIATSLLRQNRIDSVAIGAVQHPSEPISQVCGRTTVVVLATGDAPRVGAPKPLTTWADHTCLERVVDTALAATEVERVVVVLGAESDQSRHVRRNRPLTMVCNERWAEGHSTSMQAGLAALPPATSSVILLPADGPQVTPDILDALVRRHRHSLAPLVWPEFEGKRGNLLLCDRALFSELRHLRGDLRSHPLLQAYRAQAERLAVSSPLK